MLILPGIFHQALPVEVMLACDCNGMDQTSRQVLTGIFVIYHRKKIVSRLPTVTTDIFLTGYRDLKLKDRIRIILYVITFSISSGPYL
jgi:hypothetical protein